ncbi:MAG: carbohydrate-binding protein [Deltaproteobacteria bacterium]|nr:carbohydrate-binding protein [Deltaproteobacteria bacterium]
MKVFKNKYSVLLLMLLFILSCSSENAGTATDTGSETVTTDTGSDTVTTDTGSDTVTTDTGSDTGTVTVPENIQAECAYGLDVGDCNQSYTGDESGTTLDNDDSTVGFFDNGDYLSFENIDMTGANVLLINYAKGNTGGFVELRLDGVNGILIGTFTPQGTGAWTAWEEVKVAISQTSGLHTLYLVGTGADGIANFDWLDLETCIPQCNGLQCGDDSCGGSCGNCGNGFACSTDGQCEETGTGDWQLIWSDEFNGTGLPDQTKWEIKQWAPGTVNNEVQSYTSSTNNLNQNGGILDITALNNNGVTSGRIESKVAWAPAQDNSVSYRIETKSLMTGGGGAWPAFWLLGDEQGPYGGWPGCGELDIFEYVGNTGYFQCAAHDDYAINHTMQSYNPTNPETEWHVYGANLYGDRVEFFVDDYIFHTFYRPATWSQTNWPYTGKDGNTFHIILNLAIGGMMGGDVDYNDFPMVQKFDYVRVYQK